MRTLRDLRWVQFMDNPHATPRPLSKAQQEGLRYEAANARYLQRLFRGNVENSRWIHFEDGDQGLGWAQPDHFVLATDKVVIFESKLTQTVQGDVQLKKKYGPLLEFYFKRPCVLVQVFRNIVEQPEYVFDVSMLAAVKPDPKRVWHWHRIGAPI